MRKFTLVDNDGMIGVVINDAMVASLSSGTMFNACNPKKIKNPAQFLIDEYLTSIIGNSTCFINEREVFDFAAVGKNLIELDFGEGETEVVNYREVIAYLIVETVTEENIFGW